MAPLGRRVGDAIREILMSIYRAFFCCCSSRSNLVMVATDANSNTSESERFSWKGQQSIMGSLAVGLLIESEHETSHKLYFACHAGTTAVLHMHHWKSVNVKKTLIISIRKTQIHKCYKNKVQPLDRFAISTIVGIILEKQQREDIVVWRDN